VIALLRLNLRGGEKGSLYDGKGKPHQGSRRCEIVFTHGRKEKGKGKKLCSRLSPREKREKAFSHRSGGKGAEISFSRKRKGKNGEPSSIK